VVEGVEHIIEPGSVVVIPPHAKHYGTSITDCRLLDVFCPVREDYKKL
jgi:quercetin dioxygenase-like cupin family protein